VSANKSLIDLVESLEEAFPALLNIIKAIGNNKRFKILLLLLTGEKTFMDLKNETDLQKTALSNHLTTLINRGLIEKPSIGNYEITQDGELFVRALENAYRNSTIWEKIETETLQRGQFSENFVESFFGKS